MGRGSKFLLQPMDNRRRGTHQCQSGTLNGRQDVLVVRKISDYNRPSWLFARCQIARSKPKAGESRAATITSSSHMPTSAKPCGGYGCFAGYDGRAKGGSHGKATDGSPVAFHHVLRQESRNVGSCARSGVQSSPRITAVHRRWNAWWSASLCSGGSLSCRERSPAVHWCYPAGTSIAFPASAPRFRSLLFPPAMRP